MLEDLDGAQKKYKVSFNLILPKKYKKWFPKKSYEEREKSLNANMVWIDDIGGI